MKVGGYSLNVGRGKVQFVRLPIGKPRPQIDGEDCYPGFRFDVVWGPLVMPVAKVYHWKFWAGHRDYAEQWNNGNQWFTIKLPYFAFFFVSWMFGSFSFGSPGMYIGARTADLSNRVDWQLRVDWDRSEHDPRAWGWNKDGSPTEAWPVGKYIGTRTVELSAALRSDFRH